MPNGISESDISNLLGEQVLLLFQSRGSKKEIRGVVIETPKDENRARYALLLDKQESYLNLHPNNITGIDHENKAIEMIPSGGGYYRR